MNINHFEYVVAISKYGSINRAAKELYVSQPYLSGVLKGLEEELGFSIFRRTNTGIQPTQLGEDFLEGAKRVLLEIERIRSLKEDRDQSLKIASYYSPFFMKCFLDMRSQYGFVSNDSFQEMPFRDCIEHLHSEQVNLSLICYASRARSFYEKLAVSKHCRCEYLIQNSPLSVMMRKEHPLSKKTKIDLQDIYRYPIVYFRDSFSFLKLLGLENHPNLVMVSDRASQFDTILGGDYIGFMSIIGKNNIPVKTEFHYTLLNEPGYELDFVCLIRDNYQLSIRERRFLQFIRSRSLS